jgi:dethiobiotin synthetase
VVPHLAAIAEGKRLDPVLLRRGLDIWLAESDIVLIEGAGGLMSPLGEEEYVADLAYDFGFPLLIVARNGLGAINHVLQTLIGAAAFRDGLPVAGIVLNQTGPPGADKSVEHNAREIRNRAISPLLAELGFQATRFDPPVDWSRIAAESMGRHVAVEDGK